MVFGGGIIPDADIAALTAQGVAKIFTPGASTTDIVAWVNEPVPSCPSLSPSRPAEWRTVHRVRRTEHRR